MKYCLVCSSGGHFLQLYELRCLWEVHEHFWVTFLGNDTHYLLNNEKKYWAFNPTNRNIKNLINNSFLAFKLLRKEKPEIIISTGAGICVPFIFIGKLLGIKTVYIESLTRVKKLSLSGKLVYPLVSFLLVQWPELEEKYKKALFKGNVI